MAEAAHLAERAPRPPRERAVRHRPRRPRINGGRNLLAKREPPVPDAAPTPVAERPARRRERTPEPAVDAEVLIKQVVGKLQAQGNAEVDRLRDAIRKAMAVLAGAIGDA